MRTHVLLLLAYLFRVDRLIGLGFANSPISRLLGRPASLREKESEGIGRYRPVHQDHKGCRDPVPWWASGCSSSWAG